MKQTFRFRKHREFQIRSTQRGHTVIKMTVLKKKNIKNKKGKATSYIQGNCHKAAAASAKSLQSCPTLCDPIDCSPPGSSIPGFLKAVTREWVSIFFSDAWKWKVKVKSLGRVRLLATPWIAAYQAPPSMGFFQARVLEWGAISFSRGSAWPRDTNPGLPHCV